MAKQDDVSSTEKLLDLIRDTGQDSDSNSVLTSHYPSGNKKNRAFRFPFPFNKRIGIGVYIGRRNIFLVKSALLSDKYHEIIKYLKIRIPKEITMASEDFYHLLHSSMTQITGGRNGNDIWCSISSEKVETRCIRIPKLSKKQISNAVYWTFTKEVSFDENTMLLDYQLLEDFSEDGMEKTNVMTFTIPKKETRDLQSMFIRAGFPLKGISIVPFAIQNLLRRGIIDTQDRDACFLFIGRDWSRIAIYSNQSLVLSRSIKAGTKSIIEAIATDLTAGQQGDTSGKIPDASIFRTAQVKLYRFIKGEPDEGLFNVITSPLDRLVKQVERTLDHYSLNFNNRKIKTLYISGQVSGCKKIVSHISDQINLPIQILDPFSNLSSGTGKDGTPRNRTEREHFIPAIGMSLSDNDITPNFLYTQSRKDDEQRSRQANLSVFIFCIIGLLIMLGIFLYQKDFIRQKNVQIDEIKKRLEAYSIPADKNLILELYSKSEKNRLMMYDLANRYKTSAIVQEIIRLKPENIQLLQIKGTFGTGPKRTRKTDANELELEGIIIGERINFESDLAGFLLNMGASPLFKRPGIKKKSVVYYKNRQVLQFSVLFEVI